MKKNNLVTVPVSEVIGVGPEKEKQLNELGIVTVEHLLEYFPTRYEDYQLKDLAEVSHDERVTVEGKVHSEPSLRFYGKKRSRMTVKVLVGRYLISAVFFNQPFAKKQLTLGMTVTLTGKWDQHKSTLTVNQYKLTPHQGEQELQPIYSVKSLMKIHTLRKFIVQAFKQYAEYLPETLPRTVLQKYKLLPRKDALYRLHFPNTQEEAQHARRRFVYEEFLQFQLKVQAFRKFDRENDKGMKQEFSESDVSSFIKSLPFPLTNAQDRVVKEVLNDMQSDFRMNRLLQGDVGSGKTIVAAICLYATVKSGNQGALMVPTEILAEQHVESLKEVFSAYGITVELLTSSIKGKKRREILSKLVDGSIDIAVGTHALIQDEIIFKQLGLVITDEQHRFGVNQRRVLKEKGESPDVLFMTATPIPRTLSITAFGEMDVSIIDEYPAGRKEIKTYWAKHDMMDRILAFIDKELKQGRQAYVICPLIEESENLDVQNAHDIHAMLQQYFAQYQVGLMHGRLAADEKEAIMQEFGDNKVQVLVSTTVVEVGVNVPNATVMVIYDAERFGLSQLHQLRGRVGRGSAQSYCILLADPKTEVGKERMQIMTETNDGFVLAEKDLELRGPGDFFGTKQSGVPEFKVADMIHDYRALEIARQDAEKLVASTSFWEADEWAPMRDKLEKTGVFSGEKLD
ncbi:ATP-dependent DNA helicase RecG [Lottiidibacillus patelloidae]|uniref:ATP-dependent DNA helicase RecG n=1 Tax=Lottiidibacillus patelloidae TaxID=2670334 RepID=A0A263BXX5_9BACI|nr:ATP-dependent DNA helicase RecG [Lottiidibacillus patelloidae]OZM58564.1 ATP-dependent DNA helicase RecG [Lottiidibacillus patelloidae]